MARQDAIRARRLSLLRTIGYSIEIWPLYSTSVPLQHYGFVYY